MCIYVIEDRDKQTGGKVGIVPLLVSNVSHTKLAVKWKRWPWLRISLQLVNHILRNTFLPNTVEHNIFFEHVSARILC